MIYCQVVEEVDTNTLYKHAYCNIVNDTIFKDVRMKVSNKLIASSFMFFCSSIISQIDCKTKDEKAKLIYQLYEIDEKNIEDINYFRPHLSNQLINGLIDSDCNRKKFSNKVLNIEFSKIHSDLGYNALFAEVWIEKGVILGGECYIYFFVFDEKGNMDKIYKEHLYKD